MINKNIKNIYKYIVITFFIMIIIIGSIVFSLSILKDEAVDTNLKIAEFHTNTLTEQITQTFLNISLIIDRLGFSLETSDDIKLLQKQFNTISLNNPYIRSINLLDSQKIILYSSTQSNIGIKVEIDNFYPKPMFDEHILRFGNPWIGRDFADAKDVTLLDKVKEDSSSFLPIVKMVTINTKSYYIAININSDYFINKYSTNLENNFATLDVIRIDGILLFSSDEKSRVGTQIKKSFLIDEVIEQSRSVGIESLNGKNYLSSYRLTDKFPLDVSVKLDYEQTMIKWEEKRVIIIYIITLLVFFSVSLVIALLYRYAKEKEHEIEFQKSEQKLLMKSKEIAESANKAKSDFLANMSHEIRTPLNGVIGLTDLVLKSKLNAQQKDYLTKSQKSSNALLHLINDILDYSKIEAGKLSLENTMFELDDVKESINDLFEYQANKKGISLKIDVPQNLILIGDSLRLRQILTNLVGNAIKFTDAGCIELKVSVKDEYTHNVILHFSVKDTGIGMSKEEQINLFKEFTQADTSTTRKYGGTGLGLSISKELVNLMAGEIWVESSLGIGSEFMFNIKFVKADVLSAKDIQKKPTQNIEIENTQDVNILLVEDNKINQLVAIGILENLGFNIDVANNGQEAVSKVKMQKYDLVLMDIQMPVMGGFEATRIIREFNKEIPIVALSAAVMKEDKEKTIEAGMNAHIEKPIDQEILKKTIFKYIKQKDILPQTKPLESSNDEQIVDFYGVDMEELKLRLGNKPEIIKQLLLDFCKKYENPEKLLDVDDVQSDMFAQKIHSLKGVSGNISLKKVFELSKKIYSSESDTEKKELTFELIELLRETTQKLIVELEEYKLDSEVEEEYNTNEKEIFLRDFTHDLEQFIVIVPKRVKILLHILKKDATSEEIEDIKDDFTHYRYKEVNEKIKKIYEGLL